MGLFDRRTDTEKELDAYRNSHPTNERQSPFDKYNNTESTQNNTQSDRYNYNNENYNNSYDNTSQNRKVTFGSVFCLVLFIVSMAAFVVLTVMGQISWAMIAFGLMFVVLGITLRVRDNPKGKIHILNIIFIIIGAVIIIVSLFFSLADEQLINSLIQKIWPVLLCSVFVIVGVILLCIGIIKPKRDKARCTVSLEAEVVDIERHYSSDSDGSSGWVYAPVYRYYYQGHEYKISSNIYSSSVERVGTKQEICINPYNPNDFIEPKKLRSLSILLLVMGVMFSVVGLFSVVLVISIV